MHIELSDRCPGLTERSRIRCRVGFLSPGQGKGAHPHPHPLPTPKTPPPHPTPPPTPQNPEKPPKGAILADFEDGYSHMLSSFWSKSQKICL